MEQTCSSAVLREIFEHFVDATRILLKKDVMAKTENDIQDHKKNRTILNKLQLPFLHCLLLESRKVTRNIAPDGSAILYSAGQSNETDIKSVLSLTAASLLYCL